jgi:predicted aspartyl protease
VPPARAPITGQPPSPRPFVFNPFPGQNARPKPQTDNCGALQLLNEVALKPVGDGLMVPVTVDGHDMEFLLDTASQDTVIGSDTAEQANIPVRSRPVGSYVRDAQGHLFLKIASISSFGLGRLKGGAAALTIMPDLPAPGVLGLDYLAGYDVDLDFGANRLRQFSPDHCVGKVMYWQAPVLGHVALEPSKTIQVRVELDGQSILAVINTSAPKSAIGDGITERLFHLTPAIADKAAAGEGSPARTSTAHTFSKLSFGDIEIQHPSLDVIALKASDNPDFANLIIGMDVLRQLHVYFAFQERMLYVSPASQPAQDPATAANPPATRAPAATQ